MTTICGGSIEDVEKSARELHSALDSVETWVHHVDIKSMSQRELYTMTLLLEEVENAQLENLNNFDGNLFRIRQFIADIETKQHVYDKIDQARQESLIMDGLTSSSLELPDPHKFQWENGAEIEERLARHKCRGFRFEVERPLPVEASLSVKRYLGVENSSDLPIEILQVSDLTDPFEIDTVANRTHALKCLTLSNHFVTYKGVDHETINRHTVHLFQAMPEGISLGALLDANGPLHETDPFFLFVAREVWHALCELLEQCPHEIHSEISAEHVLICRRGASVVLDGLIFGPIMQSAQAEDATAPNASWRDGAKERDARIMRMYGSILVHCVTGVSMHEDTMVRTLMTCSAGLRSVIRVALAAPSTIEMAVELRKLNKIKSGAIDDENEGVVETKEFAKTVSQELRTRKRYKNLFDSSLKPNLEGTSDATSVGSQTLLGGGSSGSLPGAPLIFQGWGDGWGGMDTKEKAGFSLEAILRMNAVNSRIIQMRDLGRSTFLGNAGVVKLNEVIGCFERYEHMYKEIVRLSKRGHLPNSGGKNADPGGIGRVLPRIYGLEPDEKDIPTVQYED